MTTKELTCFIEECIKKDKIYKFYKTKEWITLRDEVLKEQHYECQLCKSFGKYTRAVLVHHTRYVRDYPQLALTKEYKDKLGKRHKNLLALCNACHEEVHDRNHFKVSTKDKYTNNERW